MRYGMIGGCGVPSVLVNGIDNLNPVIWNTYPTSRYRAFDASASGWNSWGYGQNLTYEGTTNDPDFNQSSSPLTGPSDSLIHFNGTGTAITTPRRFHAATGSLYTANASTDQIIEVVYKAPNSVSGYNISIAEGSSPFGADFGIYFQIYSNFFYVVCLSKPTDVAYGPWSQGYAYAISSGIVHLMLIKDSSLGSPAVTFWNEIAGEWETSPATGDTYTYVNSVYKGRGAYMGDCIPAFGVGATIGSSYNGYYSAQDFYLSYVSSWKGSSIVDSNKTNIDALVLARYNALFGL